MFTKTPVLGKKKALMLVNRREYLRTGVQEEQRN